VLVKRRFLRCLIGVELPHQLAPPQQPAVVTDINPERTENKDQKYSPKKAISPSKNPFGLHPALIDDLATVGLPTPLPPSL